MPSMQVTESLDTMKSALDRKGFDDLMVTHYDNTPVDHVVLHDDHGRLARGEHDQILRIIEEADDQNALWSALTLANLARRPSTSKS